MSARDRITGILTSAMGSEVGAVDLLTTAESEDGSAYRLLSDAVAKLMGEHTDPNRWDGDEAACSIEAEFLAWLPDMIRHADARKLREWVNARPQNDYTRKSAVRIVADDMDPFRRCDTFGGCDRSPHWVRKSDGEEVPWRVLPEDEQE